MLLSDLTINISASTVEAIATSDLTFYAQVKDDSQKEVNQNFFGSFDNSPSVVVSEPTQKSSDETVYDKIVEKMIFNNIDTIDHIVNISMVSVSGIGVAPFVIQSTLLLAGERMEYVNGIGWSIYDINGLKKNDNGTETFAVRMDKVGGNITYIGQARPGSFTSSPVWMIRKMDESGGDLIIQFADGNDKYDNIWDSRLLLSYS